VEDFAGQVALLAADDFGHGQTLCGSAVGVGPVAGVVAKAHDGGDVQRTVAGPVAAAV